jgi:3-hydroxyethyl bacteriochlorophyllide a dehydrogenase
MITNRALGNPGAGRNGSLDTLAVVLEAPRRLGLGRLELDAPGQDDLLVEIDWTGVSTGTERLLWSGEMPAFPGMGYPLVPGYEAVGRVVEAPGAHGGRLGERVFVPGARCFGAVRGLFGAAARHLVVPAARAVPAGAAEAEEAILLALAATAHHAIAGGPDRPPQLVVGHGVVGRLIARVALALGHPAPTVWETNPARRDGAEGYAVIDPAGDTRRDYTAIMDASGDAGLIDTLVQRLAHGGEIALAGFYHAPVSFSFPPAFMREARLRIAAEWKPADLAAVQALIASGRLSLAGLLTHRRPAADAVDAYRTAFEDSSCLKMVLDWRGCR